MDSIIDIFVSKGFTTDEIVQIFDYIEERIDDKIREHDWEDKI